MKTYFHIFLVTLVLVSNQFSLLTVVSLAPHETPTTQNEKVTKPQNNTKEVKKTEHKKQEKITSKTKESTAKKESISSSQQDVLTDSQITLMRSTFLQLINQERNQPVSLESSLISSAQLRAQEASQKLSHTRPNGQRWNTTLINIINIKSTPHGENLAQTKINIHTLSDQDLIQIVKQLHSGLVNSPTHYHVMTNSDYKKVNIGIHVSIQDQTYVITIAQHYIAS